MARHLYDACIDQGFDLVQQNRLVGKVDEWFGAAKGERAETSPEASNQNQRPRPPSGIL